MDGGLLTIGEIDKLDSSLSVPIETLIVIESGLYPFVQPRRIIKATDLRFRGQIFYQSNPLQDHIMLPKHLVPDNTNGFYSIDLSKDNPKDVAYLLVNFDQGIGVISTSFYHICRYCQDFGGFKINGILLSQSKVYSQQSPKLNLSSDLLGPDFETIDFPNRPYHDFNWGDDYTPSVIAHVDLGEIEPVPFGSQHSGSLIGIGNFKTWYVTAFNEIPENHLNNLRHMVIDLEVTQIKPYQFLINTVTTPEYLDILIEQHKLLGQHRIHITSETRNGLPIYIVYNLDIEKIEECYITYSPFVLQDYINAKNLKFVAVNTEQPELTDTNGPIEKEDRYEHADMSLSKVLNKQEQQETEIDVNIIDEPEALRRRGGDEGMYNPDENVLALQKAQHASEMEQKRLDELHDN